MGLLFAVLLFCFGAIIGSFLNVVALRYNTGRSVVSGRSVCFSCGHELGFFDLVPVFSFLISSGRCRYCGSGISAQYPLIEALTGFLFVAVFALFPFWYAVYLFPVVSLLVVILLYDLKHKIIPNAFVYTLIALSALPLFFHFETFKFSLPSITHALAGPILFVPFFLLWFVSKGRWMGLGDGKLAWAFGWFLGLSKGVAAVLMGFWIGAIVGVLVLVAESQLFRKRKRLTMKSEIPFAPFLIAGFLAALFLSVDFYSLSSWLTFQ